MRKKRKYRGNLGETQTAALQTKGSRARSEIIAPNHSQSYKSSEYTVAKQKESVLNETDKKIIRYAIYAGSALLLTSVGFFLIRSKIRKARRLKAEKETLSDNTPENFAKRFIMAFDNDGLWGTDVEAVRRIFVQIPSKDLFDKIAKKYWELSGSKRNLFEDLSDELTTTELYEMQSILAAKPDKAGQPITTETLKRQALMFARRMNSAVNYKVLGMPATDEDAIRQVIAEIPTRTMWRLTDMTYMKEYGMRMEQELDEDLGYFDFSWRDMVKKKPA